MSLGGPVWHASVAGLKSFEDLEKIARMTLKGVGDSSLGEWVQRRILTVGNIVHIRRRLSLEEQKVTGPAVDIRGTPEAERRLRRAKRWQPYARA